ncbi:T9SS type A sorting domain-containing protein [Candidatus Fermentibacteria bacterium]|nr:T9SS type A sorting domain-containing protein [Candidatus Fermentibacteria bacterium]
MRVVAMLLALLLVPVGQVSGGESIYDLTVQTRNPDPNWVDRSDEEYSAQVVRYEPFRARVIVESDGDPEMAILMEEGLSDSIGMGLLQQWIDDIEAEEYATELIEISYADPEEVKSFLDSLHALGLKGSVLVGDLPAGWVAVWDTEVNMGEKLPCDYFFMDLDGSWQDLWIGYPRDSIPGQDGFYDTFEGELDPELWSARIKTDNLTQLGDPVEMIQDYLGRNHEWRLNGDPEPVVALCYVDDDWQYSGPTYQAHMQLLYENVELVNASLLTCDLDYEMNRLPGSYVWISPFVHSNPNAHFWQPSAGTTSWDELVPLASSAHFYNLFACSNCRFTSPNYMGGVYSLATEPGLAAVGSTTSGAMLWFREFYGPLGGGGTLGEAFRLWWDHIAEYGLSQHELNWHIGMVLLGDPSLVPAMHATGLEELGETPAEFLQVSIYPNPCGGEATVELRPARSGDVRVSVYDVSGRLVEDRSLPGCSVEQRLVRLGEMTPGVYMVRASAGDYIDLRKLVVLD